MIKKLEELNWDILKTSVNNEFALVICPEKEVDGFIGVSRCKIENSVAMVVAVRGKRDRCINAERLFQEWAAALQFPWYFGHNWSAFDECINDLEWLPYKAYVVFITHIDTVLKDSDHDFEVFVRLLKDAMQDWSVSHESYNNFSREALPFHIIFHCEPENAATTRERLKEVGVDDIEIVTLPDLSMVKQ